MTVYPSCPEPARWQEMLEGSLPDGEQAALGGHLETCGHCQQTLEGLAAGQAAWRAAARHLGGTRRPDEAALGRVLAALEGQAAVPLTPGEVDAEGVPWLDFLSPTEKPGHLGRLDHYEVLEVLGWGGMGVVLKAFDESLQRVVAIKVMAPQLASNPTARKRFLREARAAAAVRHEHVIDVHAVDEANGLPYLVMECVGGTSLQQRLDRLGPLPVEEVLRIGLQTAAGLAAAHAQGLVHRDVKPANILLENGVARVKITDFGLARAADDVSLSQTGAVAGTPEYMAPEQARGAALDHRADLFSLGSVLYAMATGRAPFQAECTLGLLRLVAEEAPPPMRDINPDLPAWLAAVVERLHAKDAAGRYQSAAEVAELLGRHLARLQSSGQPSPTPDPSPAQRRRWRERLPRVRVLRWAAAAAALALVGVSMTEATGVTQVVPTVVRVVRGDGTLVVEVDDPQVKVSVEGDGGVVITGAVPGEVRLPPGSYRLRASKGGDVVREEVVTILRGGRQLVRVTREARRFEGHTGSVQCVAVAPDGRLALSGSDDRSVRLWDVATGMELRRFDGHTDEVVAVAFSPDGKRAASAGADRTIRLWEVSTGRSLGCCRGHTDTVRALAFVPGGPLLVSGSEDGTLRLWDSVAGAEVRTFAGHQGWVTSVAASGDGRRVLSGGADHTVRVWDLRTGAELHRLEGHTGEVYSVAFAADGRRAVSGGNDRTVRLWDVDGGRELRCLKGHANAVVCVAFSADGRQVLSASSQHQTPDRTVRIWDAASGREVCSFGGAAADRLGCAAFAPDGSLAVSGSADQILRLWQLSR